MLGDLKFETEVGDLNGSSLLLIEKEGA